MKFITFLNELKQDISNGTWNGVNWNEENAFLVFEEFLG
jgi:hypothetical protein